MVTLQGVEYADWQMARAAMVAPRPAPGRPPLDDGWPHTCRALGMAYKAGIEA
jgi:hypothetical protein